MKIIDSRLTKNKLGRNDPCHCGSGKKYKKCCLLKERAQELEEARARKARKLEEARARKARELEEEKVRKEYMESYRDSSSKIKEEVELFGWDLFQKSSFEEKIAIFEKELEKVIPFELLEIIYQEAWRNDKTGRFKECLRFLQINKPKSYQEYEIYYSFWLLEIAIANQDYTQIPNLLEVYYNQPDKNIDKFNQVIDLLMYSGQIAELSTLMIHIVPQIESSFNIIPQGIDEFFGILCMLKIIEFINRKATSEDEMKKLIIQFEKLEINFKEENLKQTILRLAGNIQTEWKSEEFDLIITNKKRNRIFFTLSLDFMRYLNTNYHIHLAKGELARQGMLQCWINQKKFTKKKGEASTLYPREREFDKSLAPYAEYLAPRPSRLAAVVETIPFLILFLTENGLIHRYHIKTVLSEFERLKNNSIKYLQNLSIGLYYISNINNAWDQASQLINENSLFTVKIK